MKQKYKMIIGFMILVAVFSTLFLTNSIRVQAADPIVESVTNTPEVVYVQTNVTIGITFDNDTNVIAISLYYCAISPSYHCHLPSDMQPIGSNTWVGSFIVGEISGVIGYRMLIKTTNNTMYAPNSSSYLDYDNIVEPSTDLFYFSINITPLTNETPLMSLCGVASSFVIIASTKIIRSKKRK